MHTCTAYTFPLLISLNTHTHGPPMTMCYQAICCLQSSIVRKLSCDSNVRCKRSRDVAARDASPKTRPTNRKRGWRTGCQIPFNYLWQTCLLSAYFVGHVDATKYCLRRKVPPPDAAPATSLKRSAWLNSDAQDVEGGVEPVLRAKLPRYPTPVAAFVYLPPLERAVRKLSGCACSLAHPTPPAHMCTSVGASAVLGPTASPPTSNMYTKERCNSPAQEASTITKAVALFDRPELSLARTGSCFIKGMKVYPVHTPTRACRHKLVSPSSPTPPSTHPSLALLSITGSPEPACSELFVPIVWC